MPIGIPTPLHSRIATSLTLLGVDAMCAILGVTNLSGSFSQFTSRSVAAERREVFRPTFKRWTKKQVARHYIPCQPSQTLSATSPRRWTHDIPGDDGGSFAALAIIHGMETNQARVIGLLREVRRIALKICGLPNKVASRSNGNSQADPQPATCKLAIFSQAARDVERTSGGRILENEHC